MIDDADFTGLYALASDGFNKGELTDCLLEAGINPLEYMNEIPPFYASWSRSKAATQIPNHIKSIGEYAFNQSSLTSITIPDSVRQLGRGIFSASQIKDISLGDSITRIPAEMADYCARLERVILSN